MSFVFEDDDPEDSWDAGDTDNEKLGVLERWLPSVDAELDLGGQSTDRAGRRLTSALESLSEFTYHPGLTPDQKDRIYKLALYAIFLVLKRG